MGSARRHEGCSLRSGCQLSPRGLGEGKDPVFGTESWDHGGLHLPLNLSPGGSLFLEISESGTGRVLGASGPLSSFVYGNTEAPGVGRRVSSLGNRVGNEDAGWETHFLLLLRDQP